MVLAVKRAKLVNPEKTLKQIEEIKQFYGIQEQTLEKMLKEHSSLCLGGKTSER